MQGLTLKATVGALLALCLASVCAAAPADWQAGTAAYAAGNYQLALQHFEAARDDGLDGPAIHYNLAVCNFQLDRFDRAETEFQHLVDRYPKMRALGEYNLGLIDRRQGKTEAATAHFLKAYELSADDTKLRILASNRLRELEPELRGGSAWVGAVGLRAGFDDNVALRDETGLPATVTAESPVIDFFASIKGPYDGVSGFRFEGSAYMIRNIDADEFDQGELYGGVQYDWRIGDWRLQLGVHGSAGTLGGDSFDRKIGSNIHAIRYLNSNSEFGISFVYDDVQDADTRFAGIGGTRQQRQATYRWYSGARYFVARYRAEDNDRLSANVSPTRKLLDLRYRVQPRSGWGYEAGLSVRNSRFDEMTVPRDEDLVTFNVAVTRSLRHDWLVMFDYRHANNDSSDADFSYDRNVFTLGAMKTF